MMSIADWIKRAEKAEAENAKLRAYTEKIAMRFGEDYQPSDFEEAVELALETLRACDEGDK